MKKIDTKKDDKKSIPQSMPYAKNTNDIVVSVEPTYLNDQSAPDEDHYVWAYRVQIENQSKDPVTLRSRFWQITDSNGHKQEISGEGVVGDQPLIKPGDHYEYTSGAPLKTPSGFMMGSYMMEMPNGEFLEIEIPAFSLDSPYFDKAIH